MVKFKELCLRLWGPAFIWFVFSLFLDQLSKIWALQTVPAITSHLFPYGGLEIVSFGSIDIALVLAFNKGAAWSLLWQYPLALFAIRLALVAFLLFWTFSSSGYKKWAGWTILAGAIGNIIDICLRGAVVDMISLTFWGYPYPIFNLADMMICLGAISFIGLEFMYKEEK